MFKDVLVHIYRLDGTTPLFDFLYLLHSYTTPFPICRFPRAIT